MQEFINISESVVSEEALVRYSNKHEEALVERAKEDPHAFGELFDKYYDPILNYIVHRTANTALSEELTSNTFFSALNNIHTFHWRNIPFSAWLYKIASNEINGFFRKNKNGFISSIEESHEFIEDELTLADMEIKREEKEIAKNNLFQELHRALVKIKPKYQEVIVLKYFEKKSISEISEITGKAEGTIKSLLHRGLSQLKELIGTSFYGEVTNE
ncbi:MAG: RNA polymerase sigma factor [Bacteroidetes bacterium]|nr:RNA polymerase sigma factor [Bacteroidota bacterium]MBU1115234.1 RNA polymerase sigma factor [Bacteroidota bacterium]MBU1797252.1 RNA polymerase sigma factor [Bacteroidota bacterium]